MSKISFSEFTEFGSKVTKEKTKKTTPKTNDGAQEQRHEKINFKTYLRDLKENQSSDDEFQDVAALSSNDLARRKDGTCAVDLSTASGIAESKMNIGEDDLEDIFGLEKDDSITILDESDYLQDDATNGYAERWYVTRTLTNQLVFENQDGNINGQIDFNEFVKKLR